jgi:uncharacterized membrane protein
MTLKQYQIIRIIVVILVSFLVAQSIILRSFLLPIIGIASAMMILFYLRGKLKNEVLADERDYEIGDKSARWTIQIFSIFAVVVMIFLYAKQDLNPSYLPIASTLAYSTCFLMILYSVIFRYFQKSALMKNKNFYIVLMLIGLLIMIVFGMRLLSGEDDWICQDGQWIKHGQPDFPMPTVMCK